MSLNTPATANQLPTVLIGLPCLLVGGTENQTLYLVKALTELKFRVIVVCYFEWDSVIVSQYRKVGAIVLLYSPEANKDRINTFNWLRPTGWSKVWFLFCRFRKTLQEYRPEFVHVQYLDPGTLPILIFRFLGVRRLYATVHQSGTPYGKRHHLYLRMAARFCTRFTGISGQVLDSWFGPKWPHHVKLLYNTIDTENINRIKANTDTSELKASLGISGKQVIGTIARLSHIKGVDLLLDAFSGICAQVPDSVLVIVGDGNCRKELEEQAQKNGIADRILWMGKQSPEKAIAIGQIFDICVCPSRNEGFGLIVLEALASGIPVVAFRVGGLPEVIEDRVNGILIPPGNVTELARACIELLGNGMYRKQLADNGDAALNKYGFDAYKQAVGDLYGVYR